MVEQKEDVKTTAPVPADTPVPASKEQPTPAAVKPAGDASKPADVKPQESLVPLPALQEERSKRQALEAEIAELRKMVQSIPQQPQQQVNPRAEIEKLWEEDPRKAVQAEIRWEMGYRDWVDATLELQADQMSQKYPDFNNYRSVVMSHLRSLPLEQRIGNNPQQPNIEAAYWMVRGQKFDSLLHQKEAEIIERYRRGELTAQGLATPPGSFSSPTPSPTIQLTEDQRKVAEAMGLTPEAYASQMKRLP